MADYVERYSGKASDELEKQIRQVYKQAAEEVQKKLDDFIRGHKARNAQMLQMVSDGKMSKQDYQRWMRGQVFQGDQWKQKLKDVTDVYVHADEKAREIVGSTSKNVFMEAANYTAYDLEKGMRGAVAFNVYDAKTVERLLKKDPKMLPEWKIDQPKDYKWNEKRVRNAVTQGIIQGESVEEVGERLTGELATSNASKMDMFARTAINGSQNAGRMDRLHKAEEMGIEVRKKWLATLDQRTRDTHQALDGQEQPIDEPFVVDGMKIDYPGDPLAPPELVYNCFVGETSAYTNCEIERSYCHEYKGELIEIETSCGVKFTCTPNHPILTLGGWVSAASLHNGDDLLVTKVGNRLGFGRNCNVKHVLSCMKTFHDSFKGSGLVSRNSTLSVNFHGDIPTSEVEIITKKRFLPDNRNPGISERIKKFLFELPYKAFACKCSFMKHLWRIGFSTFSFICGKCKSFPLFWGRFGHSQKHGLRPIALFNPGGVQPLNDNVAGNIQIISNCLDGFTGIVLADNIISVNKCSGCTHVYNLQTENGYYFVNTIIAKNAGKRNGFAAISHNCRCTLTYVYPKYQHLQHNHERRDQLNDKNIENMTYYQWVGLKERSKRTDANEQVDDVEFGELFPSESKKIAERTIGRLEKEYPLKQRFDFVGDGRISRDIDRDMDFMDIKELNIKDVGGEGGKYLAPGNNVSPNKMQRIEIFKEDVSTQSLKSEFDDMYKFRKSFDENPVLANALFNSSYTLEGVLTHEYGHALAENYGFFAHMTKEGTEFNQWLTGFMKAHPTEVLSISRYATTNVGELFAEALVTSFDDEHKDTMAYKTAKEIMAEFKKRFLKKAR